MTEKRAEQADKLPVDDIAGGTALVADENAFDRRRLLWRLTSWGVTAVGAVTIAILATHSSVTLRQNQVATADLSRQTQQIRALARQNHTEANRLASAIEALDGDRDRLDARVATLEQGLDSVTGSIARERKPKEVPAASSAEEPTAPPATASSLPHHEDTTAAAAPSKTKPAPVIASPVTAAATAPRTAATASADTPSPTPASDTGAKKSGTPDATASAATPETKIMASAESASADAKPAIPATPAIAIQRTEFGVDLGSANSIDGLRALWLGVLRAHGKEIGTLEPIIVIRERTNGLGMRLHLVAGPLSDAAAAANICAAMTERKRTCETSVYDGQRLVLRQSILRQNNKSAGKQPVEKRQAPQRMASRHKRSHPPTRAEQPLPVPPPPPRPEPSRLGALLSR